MNAKSKIILAVTIAIIIIIGSIAAFQNLSPQECKDECKTNNSFSGFLDDDSQIEEEKEELSKQEAQEKIDTIRKKLALKGLILKGDIHLENKEYTNALAKFLKIHKEIPDDLATNNKIGDIYYALKKYSQAIKFYREARDYVHLDKQKYIFALLYSEKISPENLQSYFQEIDALKLSKQETFYYKNSLSCVSDFSLCKKNFQDFFSQYNKKVEEQKSNENLLFETGSEIKPMLVELKNIEDSIQNYYNFQIDDLSYKNALVSGAFFKNKLYPIAVHTAELNLNERPDYRPMLKIVAKSYYEMGQYLEAKDSLIKYNELGDKDPEISYFLGVVYEKLNEHILSTIHFKKAMSLGYHDSVDIRRRLIYNYYKLDEIEKMLSTFDEQIKENFHELLSQDLNIAIFYHILNGKLEKAKELSQRAIEKFSEDETFYAYLSWILIEEYKNQEVSGSGSMQELHQLKLLAAEKNIQKGLELNDKNPIINLIKGKLELEKGDMAKAFIYFKKTIGLDHGGEFEEIAKQELERLEALKK